jgi:hypothetical protein
MLGNPHLPLMQSDIDHCYDTILSIQPELSNIAYERGIA